MKSKHLAVFAVLLGLGHLAHIVSGILVLLLFLLYRYIAKDKRLVYFSGFAIIAHLILFSQLDKPKRPPVIYPDNIIIVPAEYAELSDQTRNPKALYTASYVGDQKSDANSGFRILTEMPVFADETSQMPQSNRNNQVAYKGSAGINKIKRPDSKELQEHKDTEDPTDKTNDIVSDQKASSDHENQGENEGSNNSIAKHNEDQNSGEPEKSTKIAKTKEMDINNMIVFDLKKSYTAKRPSKTLKEGNPNHPDIKAPIRKSLSKSSTVLAKNTHKKKTFKPLLGKGTQKDLIAAHKDDEHEINKFKDRVGETNTPFDRKKSGQPKVKRKKGINKNKLITRSRGKRKKKSRKRKKSHPDDYNHERKSDWEKRRDAGTLEEINLGVKPLEVYKKGGWKDFSVDLTVQGKAPELTIKGHDELRHKNYMWYMVRRVGLKWFYRYAPIQQVLHGYMKPGRSIVVGFNLTPKGRMRNFRFITRGTNKVQHQAVQRTFRKMRFDPPPKGFKYRNLRVRFTITKPRNLKGRGKIVWGKVYLSGQVKNLYEE